MPLKRSDALSREQERVPKRRSAANVGRGFRGGFQSSFVEPNVPTSGTQRVRSGTPSRSSTGTLNRIQNNFNFLTPTQTPARRSPPTSTQPLSNLKPLHSTPTFGSEYEATRAAISGRNEVQAPEGREDPTQTQPRPVSALQMPSLKKRVSTEEALREHLTSPTKSRWRHRQPRSVCFRPHWLFACILHYGRIGFRYNFRELAKEALQRRETEFALWSHDLTRRLNSSDDNAATMKFEESAKCRITRVLTPYAADSPAVLLHVELLQSSLPIPEGGNHGNQNQSGLLVLSQNRSQGCLAQCPVDDGTVATVMPSLRGGEYRLSEGDQVWLLQWDEVRLETGEQALTSQRYAVVRSMAS